MPNIVVLDLETKFTFDEVGGRDKHAVLGISVAGLFDYKTGSFSAIEEKDIERLESRLNEAPLVVGFNIKRFDMPVLKPYVKFDPLKLPMLDIMEEIQNVVGHRVSLDSVAKATLRLGKSGDGLDAIKYFRNGEIDKLKKYCLDDVRITRDVYEYGAKNKEVFFISKLDGSKVKVAVSWTGPDKPAEPEGQMGLF